MPLLVGALGLTIALSSHAVAAHPVAAGLKMTYEMQCGWAGPTIDVVFPPAERLPVRLARTAVLVDGKPPAAVTRSGRTVELSIARPGAVLCDVIGPGTVHVLFTRAAGIGNPARAGTYSIEASHGKATLRGSFAIR